MKKTMFLIVSLLAPLILTATLFFGSVSADCASSDPNCVDVSSLPQSSLLSNPGASTLDVVFTLIFSVIGAIALIIILLAGFSYITSRGEPERTARAKDTILYAVIGLVISGLAATIVGFVGGYF